MEGGRFIDSGTFGCVFTPPLLCKSDKRIDYGKVGKITEERFAKQEIQVANKIRRFPLARNYFLLPEPESCELLEEEKQKDPGIQQCRDEFENHGDELDLKEMKQIIMPFGGTTPFYEYFHTMSLHPKNFDFFKFMIRMLEAGSILLVTGICHFDLHPGNLLVDKHKVVRILDFGLSFPTDNITNTIINGRWKRLRFGFEENAGHPSNHNSEPPEITIMNAVRKGQFTLTQAIGLTIMGKEIFQDMDKYLGISKETSRDDLHKFWNTSSFAKKRDYVNLWKIYWPGFDSWAMGCILMETFKSLVLLPDFTKGPFVHKRVALLATLRGLLDPNPRDRLDCIEALALFDPGNPWLARFGQKWLQSRKQQRKRKI